MQLTTLSLFTKGLAGMLLGLACIGYSYQAWCWGSEGHTAVGVLTIRQMQPEPRQTLAEILGSVSDASIGEACNWPDTYREQPQGEWSSSLHYVNVPRNLPGYSQARDCPDRQCVTEAIKQYAVVLSDRQADPPERQTAFAWLCHLVADLHQPLHAGYADDRGGNSFEVVVDGQPMNLHTFWDHALIEKHAGDWQTLARGVAAIPTDPPGSDWRPSKVDDWTNESHILVENWLYTADREIDSDYEMQSWDIIQKRISSAATRFAWLLNSILKP